MVHPSSINHGDKKKFKSSKKRKRSAIVETSMAGDRSSSDSDPDSKSKKFKNNEGEFILRYLDQYIFTRMLLYKKDLHTCTDLYN